MSLRALTLRVILVTAVLVPAAASLSAATPAAPTVKSVSPRAGALAGGDSVTITGSGFVSGDTTVDFGANASPSVTVTTPGKLTAIAPAGTAGTVDVTVTTGTGTSPTGEQDKYAYGAPTVTAVSPNAGPTAGGNTVTITGTAFVPGATVRFGSTIATPVTFVSGTELQALAPAGSAGTVNVRVSTPAGSSDPGAGDEYTYGSQLTMSSLGELLAGNVPLQAQSATAPGPTGATVDFEYSPTGRNTWTPACAAVSTTASYTCNWDSAAAPDGVYDLRAVSNSSGTAPTLSGITVSNSIPAPTISGARDGQIVQGQLTLSTNPLAKPDLAGLSQNLVPNWSMESLDERGSPVGWRAVAQEPDFLPQLPVGLEASSVFKPTAAGAAQMNAKDLKPGAYAFAWSYTRRIPVIAGHSYTGSVLTDVVTVDPGLYSTVMVTWYDGNNHLLSSQQGTVTRVTGVSDLTLKTTAPTGAANAVFSPAIFNTGSATGTSRVIFTAPRFELGTGTPAVNENVTVQYRYPSSAGGWQDLVNGCQITQTSTFQCPLALDQLVDGPVELRIAAVDNAGHFGYSPAVTPTLFRPGIAFTQPSYTAHESQRALTVTVARSDTSADEFFYYGVQALSAQPGVDLGAAAPVAAEMRAGQSTYTFQVPITDRGINGPPLQAQLYLTNSDPQRIATASAPLTILRDDPLQRRGRSNPLGLRGAGRNPLHGVKLYVPGALSTLGQVQQQLSLSDPKAGATLARIGADPLTRVFTAADGSDISSPVAAYLEQASVAQPGTVPLLATHYLAPPRCTAATDPAARQAAYGRWIKSLAYGIGNFRTVVFLEVGAAATSTCMSARAQSVRASEIAAAVRTLEADPHVVVYVDGGSSGLRSVASSARLLKRAGVAHAQGFFLNARGYDWVTSEVSFGQKLSARVHRKGFVIDTSQDGRGPVARGASCKQHNRGLGPLSTHTGYAGANALLWISGPGISDGSCTGSPAAGSLWPSYAVSLVAHAVHKITGPHYRLRRASHFVEYGAVPRKSAR